MLFEECRAQLYSSYEESLEAVGRDAHVVVRVKTVDRRERGMCDCSFPVYTLIDVFRMVKTVAFVEYI